MKQSDHKEAFNQAFSLFSRSNRQDAAVVAASAALNIEPMDDAIEAFSRLAIAAPNDAGIQNDYGGLLCKAHRFEEAEKALRRALENNPNDGGALFNLGHSLLGQNLFQDAETVFKQVMKLLPENPAALAGLGDALDSQERTFEAIDFFRKAHNLMPSEARFRNKFEEALIKCGVGYNEREKMYLADLTNNPFNFNAAMELICVFSDTGRRNKAWELIETWLLRENELAIRDQARLREILSELQFLNGDFKTAMANYHWRLKRRNRWGGAPSQPEWQGEPLHGKSILVFAEQGIGDQVLFMALLKDLQAAGARVVLESDPRLLPLFQRSFPLVTCVPVENPPVPETLSSDLDFHVAMGSLGCWLWDNFSRRAHGPYLQADDDRTTELRKKYKGEKNVRLVGVSWKSPLGKFSEMKSLALRDLVPILQLPHTRFIDLQYGETKAERREVKSDFGVEIVHDTSVDQMKDLDGFAAQIAAMDTVVSVSVSAAHMAGALGVPTYVLLSPAPQWKWGGNDDKVPWYPNVQLLRRSHGDTCKNQIDRATKLIRDQ